MSVDCSPDVACELINLNKGGRLFQTSGPQTEKGTFAELGSCLTDSGISGC